MGDLRVVDCRYRIILPLVRNGKVYGHSGFLYIPSRFLVPVIGRHEISYKITEDRDFALVYYVVWFLSRHNVTRIECNVLG
jgi:hypothetical protein